MTVRAPESRRSRRTRAASGQIFTYLYRAGITVILDNRRGGMDVAALITAALEQGGTPVAILRHPELGGGAVFGYVNGAFSRLLGQPRQALVGMALEALEDQIADPVVWSTLLSAAKAATPVQIVVKISAAGGENWLDLKLSFPAATGSGPRYAVLTGHNITEARREAAREEDSRRLLAAIFTRIEAPVAIVTAEGEIMMGNPALHRMLGYSSAEMHGLRVEDLTAPEYAEIARAARARQIANGERYDMPFVTVAKDGGRIPVRLTSMLLRDEDQRFRVVTLLPDIGAKGTPATRDVGELRAVSLAAFRAIFGADWERVATRAMLKAEQIIRRRLQLADVVSRSDDHHFVIWFDSADEERNAAILEGAVREIRLRFLTDFGEEVASHVTATIVAGGRTPGRPPAAIEPTLAAPRAMPTRTQFEALLLARRG